MRNKYVKISKFLSYLLRHNPTKYGIVLDEKGFTQLEDVIDVLSRRFEEKEINKELIMDLIKSSNKKRFQIENDKIRAYYGHSVPLKLDLEETEEIPGKLYHGTTKKAYQKIKKQGLKSKSRQYVHLSENIEDAIQVGKRRTQEPQILEINTYEAKIEGISFYKTGDMYLSDYIPPSFIKNIKLSK